MPPMFMRFFLLVAIALAVSSAMKANAGPLSADDSRKVQAVIVAQLAAFADDDADSAFATATPAVREAIGNSWRFLAMVRGSYPMVYRPGAVTFHKPDENDGTVLQLVEITDDEAKSWLVAFTLQRQPDSDWRIGSCAVTENHWTAV
jgi:hypothetical protein